MTKMVAPIDPVRPRGIDTVLERIAQLRNIAGSHNPAGGTPTAPGSSAALQLLLAGGQNGPAGIDDTGLDTFAGMSPVSGGSFAGMLQSLRADTNGDVTAAMGWATTQLGTPYAAVNPFRFGDVPWDGGAHASVNGNGKTYQYPAGTRVYDCSGFATAVWRKAGVDLAQYGATTTELMADRIPAVSPTEARLGDILLIDSDGNGDVDHCQLLMGNGRVIHATGGGVQYANPDWQHMVKVVRPSLLQPGGG